MMMIILSVETKVSNREQTEKESNAMWQESRYTPTRPRDRVSYIGPDRLGRSDWNNVLAGQYRGL